MVGQLMQDIKDGARWARLVMLLCGLVGCVAMFIATWDDLDIVGLTFGGLSALGSMNYLRCTRASE